MKFSYHQKIAPQDITTRKRSICVKNDVKNFVSHPHANNIRLCEATPETMFLNLGEFYDVIPNVIGDGNPNAKPDTIWHNL